MTSPIPTRLSHCRRGAMTLSGNRLLNGCTRGLFSCWTSCGQRLNWIVPTIEVFLPSLNPDPAFISQLLQFHCGELMTRAMSTTNESNRAIVSAPSSSDSWDLVSGVSYGGALALYWFTHDGIRLVSCAHVGLWTSSPSPCWLRRELMLKKLLFIV